MPPLQRSKFEKLRDKLVERIRRKRDFLQEALKTDQSLPYDWTRLTDQQLLMLDRHNSPEWQQRISALPEDHQLGYIQDVLNAARKNGGQGNA